MIIRYPLPPWAELFWQSYSGGEYAYLIKHQPRTVHDAGVATTDPMFAYTLELMLASWIKSFDDAEYACRTMMGVRTDKDVQAAMQFAAAMEGKIHATTT